MAIGIVILAAAILIADAPRPAAVNVMGDGPVKYLAGPDGLTLYVYDGDVHGDDCLDACLGNWPPLAARVADKPVGDWKPVTRDGGRLQWAHKGRPVYTFGGERNAGEAAGDGIPEWHALEYEGVPPAEVVPAAAALRKRRDGFVFTDYRGHTLYAFDQDTAAPACKGECLDDWPPLRAPAMATTFGEWKPRDRSDGVRQWSYRGKLVYAYSGDLTPSDARGADAGGVWRVLAPPQKAALVSDRARTPVAVETSEPGIVPRHDQQAPTRTSGR